MSEITRVDRKEKVANHDTCDVRKRGRDVNGIANSAEIVRIKCLITSCCAHMLRKQWMLNVRRRCMNIMSECRELRQKCNECNEKKMRNSKNTCEKHEKGNRSSVCVQNNDTKQEKIDSYEININNESQNKIRK